MRGGAAARCRALMPWLAAIVIVAAAIALCVHLLSLGQRPLSGFDFPALTLFGLTLVAVPT
ncbi:MAG: hypothetical protein QOH00_258, partial [Gaiellales bacterium]|nr:hypothetical protein [Gaiellales bacterium]